MLGKTALIILFMLMLSGCASVKENHYAPDLSTSELTLVSEAIPFNTFEDWLIDTKGPEAKKTILSAWITFKDVLILKHFLTLKTP